MGIKKGGAFKMNAMFVKLMKDLPGDALFVGLGLFAGYLVNML